MPPILSSGAMEITLNIFFTRYPYITSWMRNTNTDQSATKSSLRYQVHISPWIACNYGDFISAEYEHLQQRGRRHQ